MELKILFKKTKKEYHLKLRTLQTKKWIYLLQKKTKVITKLRSLKII